MKTMLARLLPALAPLLLPLAAAGQIIPVTLDRPYTDNMVLQRGRSTHLSGSTSPYQRVWIKFKANGERSLLSLGETYAESNGTWVAELDLSKLGNQPAPGVLSVGAGKKEREPSVTRSNVAFGEVWLLSLPRDQGVPATPDDVLRTDTEKIRFLDLAGPASVPWEELPRQAEGLARYSSLAARLGHQLANTGFVGIVYVPAEVLRGALRDGVTERGDSTAFRERMWGWLNTRVKAAHASRWRQLIDAKRRGVVVLDTPGAGI